MREEKRFFLDREREYFDPGDEYRKRYLQALRDSVGKGNGAEMIRLARRYGSIRLTPSGRVVPAYADED